MKLDRLLGIVIVLLNKETITAKELAEKFEVSTRTIYRDLDTLSLSGIPIYTSKGLGGGIALSEGYTLDRLMISDEEKANLLLGIQTLKVTNSFDADRLIDKVSALIHHQRQVSNWIEIDFTPWGNSDADKKSFELIKQGIIENRAISFSYVNTSDDQHERNVHPIKVIFKGTKWYLWAYCLYKKENRLFKVSRIRNIVLLDETFDPIYMGDQSIEGNYAYETVKLKLRFHKTILYRLYDDFKEELIKEDGDSHYLVEVSYPLDEWVYGYLLSFGQYVEVIEPLYIRDKLKERLQQTLNYYK